MLLTFRKIYKKDIDLIFVYESSPRTSYILAKTYGKPILGMISSKATAVIKKEKAGLVSSTGRPKLLVDNIIKLKEMNKKDLEKLGLNG